MGPAGLLDANTGEPISVVSFASNDYLGLASHPKVVDAAHRALDRWGTGSGASRLVTGSRPVHRHLEEALAEWKRCEQAALFSTGYAANLSLLTTYGAEDAHVFSDELNHASIIDGCRMARAAVTVFAHRDLGHLDRLLRESTGRTIIVSDTVFSMDGDAVDLDGLVDIAGRHGALLVLDEAHAVLGPELPSLPDWNSSRPRPDILRMGTLSKTLGSLGGFVAGPARFVQLLVNRARPYIFTTAPTPADAAAALAAIEIIRSELGRPLYKRLSSSVEKIASAVGRQGHASPIIPVIVGDEADALFASANLLKRGLWVPAIRPPTVAPGSSRLRITVSALHSDEQIEQLRSALFELGLTTHPTS